MKIFKFNKDEQLNYMKRTEKDDIFCPFCGGVPGKIKYEGNGYYACTANECGRKFFLSHRPFLFEDLIKEK